MLSIRLVKPRENKLGDPVHCIGAARRRLPSLPVWKYPYPQRCQIVTQDDKTWFVEITKLPDDIDRERAIDMLREQLSGYQTQPEGR